MSDDKLEQMRSGSEEHTGRVSLSCFFKTRRKTIVDNIKGFDKVGCLPKTINLSMLDDGMAFRQPSSSINTNYMTYRLQFNKTKLERAEKRKCLIEDNTAASKKFTRQ